MPTPAPKLPQPPTSRPEDDPFYWGTRVVRMADAAGKVVIWREIPLTRWDVLDPQEGDMMVHGSAHGSLVHELFDILKRWAADKPEVAVFFDVKMRWGIAGLAESAPDVSVVFGVRDKDRDRPNFSVEEEGTRPALVIEVVSPRYRTIDLRDKVAVYAHAGVEEYLIVDPTRHPLKLTAYRLDPLSGVYQRDHVHARKGWVSTTTHLRFRRHQRDSRVVIEDVTTGQRLLRAEQEAAARRTAERRANIEAKARQAAEAELARLREELDRLRGGR